MEILIPAIHRRHSAADCKRCPSRLLVGVLILVVTTANYELAIGQGLRRDFNVQNQRIDRQEQSASEKNRRGSPPSKNNGPVILNDSPALSQLDVGRNSTELQQALRPLAEKWRSSIVKLDRGSRAATVGTIVTADGLILAKFSELAQPLVCVLADGRKVPGSLAATNGELDLALIKIEVKQLSPMKFYSGPTSPTLGDFLVSVDQDGEVIGVGVVSTNLDQLPLRQNPSLNRIRMGIQVNPLVESKTIMVAGKYVQKLGLRIQRVEPRSVGEAANLIVNDLLCSVDGKAVTGLESWNAAMQSVSIGQLKSFEVVRHDMLLNTSAETITDSQRTVHDLWGGGPFSERRFDFGTVIIHDTKIRPESCGGPVFDLEGNCIGINIARSLRVASFAIPSRRILQWIESVHPSAKRMEKRRETGDK